MLEERPLRIEDVLAEMPEAEPAARRRRRRQHAEHRGAAGPEAGSIQDMVNNHPESVALLMKGWMAETVLIRKTKATPWQSARSH